MARTPALSASAEKPPLLWLPNELLFMIADMCDIKDMYQLIRCNQELRMRLYDCLIETEVKSYGARATLWAVYHGHLGLLEALHYHGVSVVEHWGHDLGPEDEELEFLSGFSEQGIQLCVPDKTGYMATSFSLLHVASARGHPKIICWLIEQGVAVNNESRGLTPCRETDHPWDCQSLDLRRPWTPLELALCYGRNASARILIGNGAAMGNGQLDLPGYSALNVAVQHGCVDIVRQLLESGDYDVNALDEHGQLAVNIAASITPFRFDFETLRTTLEAGADLAIETLYRLDSLVFFGMPALPLHQAIVCGNHGAAMMMVDAGADVNAVSAGYCPLHCVFLADNRECGGVRLAETERAQWRATRLRLLERLLREGADPNAKSGGANVPDDFLTGITPLLLAAGDATCPAGMQLLLQFGADVNALDDNQENALQWVIPPPIFTHGYIRNVVRRRGSEPQVDGVVRLLIDSGCDAGHTDMLGLCCVDRFARFDRTMEALPALLQSLGLERIQCNLSSGLRESLGSGLFDNARLFVRLGGGVSEAEVLAICDRYSEENHIEDPRAVMEFLRGMHRFSRELEILGIVLERDLKYRFRRALDSQVT